MRPEDLRGKEVGRDEVARALGYSSVEEWDSLEEQALHLQLRLKQLSDENPLWGDDGRGCPLHETVRSAVAFWEKIKDKSLIAKEIPQLAVGEDYILFSYGLHAPNNRFEMWIGLGGGVTMFTLYLDGQIAAFAGRSHIGFATDVLQNRYFLAPFRRRSASE
jgi:hypothetical protein